MLPSPNLNGQSFEDIAEQSLKRIDRYTEGWNGANVHDPGVTLIEMLSFLKVTQQERINRVGERSLRKFLKFLGMSFEGARPAMANIVLLADEETVLPAGTKFRFQDSVYETVCSIDIIDNEIIGAEGQYPFGDPPQEGNEFIIWLKSPLPQECSVHMYIELFEDYEVKRNHVSKPEEFIPTSLVRWEYYGETDGETGWMPANIIADETYNMLFPGELTLQIVGKHSPIDGGWPLRCVLERDLYEVAPKIEGMYLNSVQAAQHDTKCLTIAFDYARFEADEMLADCYLAFAGVSELYVKRKGFWVNTADLGIRHILRKRGKLLRLSVSKRDELLASLAEMDESDEVFLLVVYDKEFYDKRLAGYGSGFCGQTLRLPEGTCREGLEIMVSGKEGFAVYEAVPDFDGSKPEDCHFVYNDTARTVIFGDNVRGLVPFANSDIIIAGLKTTLGANGAVRDGCLKEPERADLFPVTVCRFKNVYAGNDAETIEDAVSRVPAELNGIRRAVTLSDYEEIAKKVQGLMLRNAAAIPLYCPEGGSPENAVTVVVEPFSEGRRISDKRYLKNVKNALEYARLAATKVYAAFPVYLGLDAHCEVIVRERGAGIADKIAEELENYVKNLLLGEMVSHAGVCGAVERVSGVLSLKYLYMEVSGAAKENALGDIVIPRHAKVYVKSAEVSEVLR